MKICDIMDCCFIFFVLGNFSPPQDAEQQLRFGAHGRVFHRTDHNSAFIASLDPQIVTMKPDTSYLALIRLFVTD